MKRIFIILKGEMGLKLAHMSVQLVYIGAHRMVPKSIEGDSIEQAVELINKLVEY